MADASFSFSLRNSGKISARASALGAWCQRTTAACADRRLRVTRRRHADSGKSAEPAVVAEAPSGARQIRGVRTSVNRSQAFAARFGGHRRVRPVSRRSRYSSSSRTPAAAIPRRNPAACCSGLDMRMRPRLALPPGARDGSAGSISPGPTTRRGTRGDPQRVKQRESGVSSSSPMCRWTPGASRPLWSTASRTGPDATGVGRNTAKSSAAAVAERSLKDGERRRIRTCSSPRSHNKVTCT